MRQGSNLGFKDGSRNAPCWLLLSNKSQLAPWIEWYSCHALFLTLVSLPPSNGWAKNTILVEHGMISIVKNLLSQ